MKPPKPTWKHLGDLRHELERNFPKKKFLVALLEGVWRVARDKSNPIRGNLVASALREVFGHIVHTLAPDAEVRKCTWFEQAKDTKTVTRRQKARYIVQAGLPASFVEDDLNLEIDDYVSPLLDAFNDLNKATHVRAETIVAKGKEVRLLVESVLAGLLDLLNAASHARSDLEHRVSETMHHAVFVSLIAETIQELDELSTHTTVDGHFIERVEVSELNSEQVVYQISGEVEVELQYGSNSENVRLHRHIRHSLKRASQRWQYSDHQSHRIHRVCSSKAGQKARTKGRLETESEQKPSYRPFHVSGQWLAV